MIDTEKQLDEYMAALHRRSSKEQARDLIAQYIYDRIMPNFDTCYEIANRTVDELEKRGLLK